MNKQVYIELKERLLELRLEKREFVLAGKNTNKIDESIKRIQKELNENQNE